MIYLIPFFSVWFAEFSTIPQVVSEWLMKRYIVYREVKGFKTKVVFNKYTDEDMMPVRLKPFDCAKCLSFWMGLIISQDIVIAGVVSLVAILTSKLINKI